MIFCGQCGLQLAPGTTRCPRCGTVVEEPTMAVDDLASPDAPTTASPSLLGRSPVGQQTIQPTPQPAPAPPTRGGATPPNNPQKLVLPPVSDEEYTYNTQAAYEGTSRVNAPNYDQQQNMGTIYPPQESYPDYRTQSGGNYPPQQMYGGYQPSGVYDQPPSSSSGRVVGLVLILLGLLLILGAIVLFALQRNNVIGASGGGATNTDTIGSAVNNTGGAAGDTQQAQAVIQHYYDAINNKDYQTAYGLWKENKQDFTTFKKGYTNTQEDRLKIGETAPQQDGSVKVNVTIHATERAPTGLKQSTYSGYYLVGKQGDGTWKIIDGNLQLEQP